MAEGKKNWTDEFFVRGGELVEKIKQLIREGNVRKIILRKENGDILFEIPLTAGVAVGGALTLLAPVIAAVGATAALLTKVRVQVVRTDKQEKDKDEES